MAHWDGTTETEEKIKEETKATIRVIPFDSPMRRREMCIFGEAFCKKGFVCQIILAGAMKHIQRGGIRAPFVFNELLLL